MNIDEKILKRECLTEEEARAIIYDDGYDENIMLCEEIEGGETRWTRCMTTVFWYKDKLYAIDWQRGLTECQEDEFWDCRPYRVEKRTKTITVNDYIPIKED